MVFMFDFFFDKEDPEVTRWIIIVVVGFCRLGQNPPDDLGLPPHF
jgi:hypothetical protein